MKLSFLFYEPIPELNELARRMAYLKSLGYQGVELSASYPPPYSAEELAAVSRELDLPVVSFLSGWSYPHEKLCLASPDADVRRRATERLRTYLDYATPLNALVVIGLMQGLRSDEPDSARAVPRIVECLKSAGDHAASIGGSLVLEPVNHLQVGFHHSAAEAKSLVAQVESPGLGYMLDTIHLHIEERSVTQAILDHGQAIRHFHLCESNGGPFGTGAIVFPAVLHSLRASGYSRYVSVKIYRHLKWAEAARSAAEFLRPIWA